jgi:protease-4
MSTHETTDEGVAASPPPNQPANAWRGFTRSAADGLDNLDIRFRNAMRRARKVRLDYVVMTVGGPLPERNGPRRGFIERRLPLPAEPLSLQTFNARLQAVADADNVRGVVLIFRGFSAGLATLQNFRAALARLRAVGKEVVVYTPYLDLVHYYAATAADRIVIPPEVRFEVLGLFAELTFLRDALAKVGVEAEVVQISPYKTAMDRLGRADISPEHREQLNWLLDDQFDMLTADMAAGRGLEQAALRALIDRSPLSAEETLAAGLVDGLAYDDELAEWLGKQGSAPGKGAESGRAQPEQPTLKPWSAAFDLLMEKPRRRARRIIGVIALEGLIAMGPSRQPPIELPIPLLGSAAAGEQTLVGLLRRVEKIDEVAAVVIYVDSGGGSALASALIGRQIERLAARKPVVVYMGDLAASGGYYVAAPARHIMSQRATLTGSIGVIQAKINTADLYDRLAIRRVTLERGEHAGLYRDTGPMRDEERAIFWRGINDVYDQFKEIVARGRGLTPEQVEAVGGGRVWTGRQALERRLVDSHGDFIDAIKKAAELAALPTDDSVAIPVWNFFARGSGYVLPNAERTLEGVARWLAGDELRALVGAPLLLLPYDLRFR